MSPETVTLFSNVISSFGFPIAAFGLLFWYILKRDKEGITERQSAADEREKTNIIQREERAQFTAAIERNTDAINALKDKVTCK